MNSVTRKIRGELVAHLNRNGLQMQGDATKLMTEFCAAQDDWQDALGQVLEAITKEDLLDGWVSLQTVNTIIAHLTDDAESAVDPIQVISAFDVPRFKYSLDRKAFVPVAEKPSLLATASAKADVFRERYLMIYQRLIRSSAFTPQSVSGIAPRAGTLQLTPVNSLIAVTGRRYVFGMLSQLEEGQYFLEDLDGQIRIDLSSVERNPGLFTEGTFVICEGEMKDGTFVVHSAGFPVPETRTMSLSSMGPLKDIDLFGGKKWDAHEQGLIADIEKADDAMFVILSDVWLDEPKTFVHLQALLQGYADADIVPAMFVLMGNFFARPYREGVQDIEVMKRSFEQLAELIAKFPVFAEGSRFLFVPGPTDPGPSAVLPRPPLPPALQQLMQKKCKRAYFGTNPCRVRYCSHDMVFFREDLVSRMRRHCILPLSEEMTELSEHLVKTVIEQSHLCPLPMRVRPIHWAYDSALRLYPIPNFIVLADKYDQYKYDASACLASNPGSFPLDTSFICYWPHLAQAAQSVSKDERLSHIQFCRVLQPSESLTQPHGDAMLTDGRESDAEETDDGAGVGGGRAARGDHDDDETLGPASETVKKADRRKKREKKEVGLRQQTIHNLFGATRKPADLAAASPLEIEAAVAAIPATLPLPNSGSEADVSESQTDASAKRAAAARTSDDTEDARVFVAAEVSEFQPRSPQLSPRSGHFSDGERDEIEDVTQGVADLAAGTDSAAESDAESVDDRVLRPEPIESDEDGDEEQERADVLLGNEIDNEAVGEAPPAAAEEEQDDGPSLPLISSGRKRRASSDLDDGAVSEGSLGPLEDEMEV